MNSLEETVKLREDAGKIPVIIYVPESISDTKERIKQYKRAAVNEARYHSWRIMESNKLPVEMDYVEEFKDFAKQIPGVAVLAARMLFCIAFKYNPKEWGKTINYIASEAM